MLKEIYSSSFIDCSLSQSPIKFNEGLNLVLGDACGSNSIGKSTFLMVIDFAFGGDTYARNEDIKKNIGNHTIMFSYQFDEVEYKFERSTEEPNAVWKCDASYNRISSIAIEEFRCWLLEMYGMPDQQTSFRDLTSCFFRIYGKNNYVEKHPLSAHKGEGMKQGIQRLLKLYNEFDSIHLLQDDLVQTKKCKDSLKEYIKYHEKGVPTKKLEYIQNQNRIEQLGLRLTDLEGSNPFFLDDADPIDSPKLIELKACRTRLRRRRTILLGRLKSLEEEICRNSKWSIEQLDALSEFFPNVNLRKIEEIESFHKQIAHILTRERKDTLLALQAELDTLSESIDELTENIEKYVATNPAPHALFEEYRHTVEDLCAIKRVNKLYREADGLTKIIKTKKTHLNSLFEEVSTRVNDRINVALSILNAKTCNREKSSPTFQLTSPSKYTFCIPDDTGTGSLARAMVLFDIVLVQQTKLPALVHDSFFLKQIEDIAMVNILKLYQDCGKQVFVALDKIDSYYGGRIPVSIENCTVLNLAKGHELFGKAWSVK